MKKLGYPDVEIIVAETGWPSGGDPQNKHANPVNAAAYNGGLLKRDASGVGTPLMPGRKFETYIFSLFNEDLKGPSLDEKNFGLFRPDFTQVYNIGILRGSQVIDYFPKLKSKISSDLIAHVDVSLELDSNVTHRYLIHKKTDNDVVLPDLDKS